MFFRITLFILIPLFILTFVLGIWIYKNEQFLNNQKIKVEVKIEKNEKFESVYNKIFKGVETPLLFDLYIKKVKKFPQKMKYGYYISDNITIAEFLNNIEDGKESVFKITIPEGYTVYDISGKLKELTYIDHKRFLELVRDRDFILKLTGQHFISLEGMLFPDTYFLKIDANAELFIQQAYNNFKNRLPEGFEQYMNSQGLGFYNGLILASIIQKETFVEEEYPLVASVFYNRLKKGMPLQSDPTVIYGLIGKFDGDLKKKDLLDETNPYNTYRHKGLPPTPICNPSLGALNGVMNPAKTDYLYFVSKKDGTHIFAKDYEAHLKNVRKYQLSK